jgi:hypothetical protein
MPITLDGSLGITTPTYGGTDTSEYLVPVTAFKNRIINGAMMIDQRNAGASVTPANNATTYTVDRFSFYVNQASKLTAQQSSTAPAGFKNSLLVTSSSAYSPTGTDIFNFQQAIEGLNVADLGFGTANASTITVSFWVRCSLTGTFGGALLNSAQDRSYPFTYTISAANTWEQKTITVAGDTSGTWLTTNGVGLTICLSMGCGTTFRGTAGAWAGSTYYSATGASNLVSTSGATFYITGVQLEKGSTATSFDYRPYGQELTLCQRYCYRTDNATNAGRAQAASFMYSYPTVVFPVTMRAAPSLLSTPAPSFIANSGNNGTPSLDGASTQNANLANASGNWTVNAVFRIDATFSAEL